MYLFSISFLRVGNAAHSDLYTAIRNGGCGQHFWWPTREKKPSYFSLVPKRYKNGTLTPNNEMAIKWAKQWSLDKKSNYTDPYSK
jgi:hypothetical protein